MPSLTKKKSVTKLTKPSTAASTGPSRPRPWDAGAFATSNTPSQKVMSLQTSTIALTEFQQLIQDAVAVTEVRSGIIHTSAASRFVFEDDNTGGMSDQEQLFNTFEQNFGSTNNRGAGVNLDEVVIADTFYSAAITRASSSPNRTAELFAACDATSKTLGRTFGGITFTMKFLNEL
ncbi:hypothetical protein BJ508DRAFT_320808 [Ascobolus immersus RN42]|uniref:Uncharacterized protein n=1 Tax=Ascobolus immersus RN42 TaxID=1160509 RepID=A0A3N4IPF5_ASCIM|nr:hypothetical protein BJ508DRAFT_320808 [Ascobolus immersus RN42]